MMTTQRAFRYLWRTNAVLIFLSTAGVCLVAGGVMLSEVGCNARRRKAADAAPPVVANTAERLYLGPMKTVEGSRVLRGELLAPRKEFGIGSGGYSGSETRNILYLDIDSTEARWLLPDSSGIIADEATVWSEAQEASTRQQVANLALVKPKSPDLQLAEGALLIFDPAGRHVITVADGVRALNHASLVDNDTILVLYERAHHYVRAMLDAHSLEVRKVEDVSVPELR